MAKDNPAKAKKGYTVAKTGQTFASLKDAARHYGVPASKVSCRRNRGWTQEQALGLEPRSRTRQSKRSDKNATYVIEDIGQTFEALSHTASHFNLKEATVKRHRGNGWAQDESFKSAEWKRSRQKPEIEHPCSYEQSKNPYIITSTGESFPSRKEAALHYQLDPNTVGMRLWNGWTQDEAFGLTCAPGNHITVEGNVFSNIKAAAEAYEINYYTFYRALKKGLTPEQAAGVEAKPSSSRAQPITVSGVKYPSIHKAAAAHGKNHTTVSTRLRRGLTPEQAVGIEPTPKRLPNAVGVIVAGVRYHSITEVADAFRKNRLVVSRRLAKGLSPEEAVGLMNAPTTKPPRQL